MDDSVQSDQMVIWLFANPNIDCRIIHILIDLGEQFLLIKRDTLAHHVITAFGDLAK